VPASSRFGNIENAWCGQRTHLACEAFGRILPIEAGDEPLAVVRAYGRETALKDAIIRA